LQLINFRFSKIEKSGFLPHRAPQFCITFSRRINKLLDTFRVTPTVTVLRKLRNENLISVLSACYLRFSFFQKESPWDVELHLAAARGDAKRLRVLLDSGRVHVDCKDKVSIVQYPQFPK